MTIANGRQRVIIAHISPVVENGSYPAKAVVNEDLVISADIFSDGHDEVSASVLIRHKKERSWKELPLTLIGNDHWELPVRLVKEGIYQFRVQAWIDHFTTWKKGLLKKHTAGQPLDIEIQIGAAIIEQASQRAKGKERKLLEEWISSLPQMSVEDVIRAIADEELSKAMYTSRNPELVTTDPGIYEIESERTKAGFSTWYELFPRSAAQEPGKHGTFSDVKKLLPRIAEMGFDVLYIPPIHPIGEMKRKGKNNSLVAAEGDPGSPWAIGSKDGGHQSIHPELGTLKEFQSLVKEALKYDIEIALDIAFQCAPDHPFVQEHPQWFRWRPDGTVQYAENPPKKYEDILPFDFETEDWENLWIALKDIIEYWIGKGVTIFRIDNPHTKSLAFWEWAITTIRKKNPHIIFLAEAFTRPRIMEQLAKAGFNQSYTYFTWRNTKKELEEYLTELTQTGKRYYFRPNFWPNTPDILPPGLTQGGENAHIMRLILAGTMSSNYGLYGPAYEFGLTEPMPGKEEYNHNEKYEIKHWDWNRYTRIGELITRLNRIRKQHPALQSTWNIRFAETDNDQVICYTKAAEEENDLLIIAVNLDPFNTQSATVKLPLEKLGIPHDQPFLVRDLLSGDKYTWQGEYNYVRLDPYEMPAHLFKVERLP
jgi:starch synthase (maltosyl-transferring)